MEKSILKIEDFKDKLINNVKNQFIDLIPEETIDAFITETVKEFEEKEIKKLINEVLREHVVESIKKMLSENSYGNYNHDTNMYEMSPEIEKILIASAPQMFGNIMREVSRMTLSNLQQSIY